MNIVFFITQKFDINAGGVERSTFKLASIFSSYHHRVLVITCQPLHSGCNFEFDLKSISDTKGINLDLFKELLDRHKVDVLINQIGFSIGYTKILLKVRKEIPYKLINTLRINPLNFVHNHDVFIEQFLSKKGLSFLNSRILRSLILKYHIFKQRYELNYIIKNIDAFILLSDRFKVELYQISKKIKQYDAKIFGINNPFVVPISEPNFDQKENIILFVGRLELIQKRTDLLLNIWKILHSKLTDWEFWIAGDGPEKSHIKKFIKNNDLNRIKYLGQTDPNPLYQKAKIFHMTSSFEGFGNVLVEAQSYGTVPIMFDSYSAAQDIVIHNNTGFLIKPFDVDTYVEKTIKLAKNLDEQVKLGKQAYEHSKKYAYDMTYEKWMIMINKIQE